MTITLAIPDYDQCALDPPYKLEPYSYEALLRAPARQYVGPVLDFDGVTYGATLAATEVQP